MKNYVMLLIGLLISSNLVAQEENLFQHWVTQPLEKTQHYESQKYVRVMPFLNGPVPIASIESITITSPKDKAVMSTSEILKYFQGVLNISKWNESQMIGASYVFYGNQLDLRKSVSLWITPINNKRVHISYALLRPGYLRLTLTETVVIQGSIAETKFKERKKVYSFTPIKKILKNIFIANSYANTPTCPAACNIFGVGSASYTQCCAAANNAQSQSDQYTGMIEDMEAFLSKLNDNVSSAVAKARRFLKKVKPIHVVGALAAAGVFQGFTNAIGEAIASGVINGSMKIIGAGLKLFNDRVLQRDKYRDEVINNYELHLNDFADQANAIVEAEIEIGKFISDLNGPQFDYIMALNKKLREEKAMYLSVLNNDLTLCRREVDITQKRISDIETTLAGLEKEYFKQCELIKTNLEMLMDNISVREKQLLELGKFLFDDKKGERKYQRLLKEDKFWARAKAKAFNRRKAAKSLRADRKALRDTRKACLRLLEDMDPRLAEVYKTCIPQKMLNIKPGNYETKGPALAERAASCHSVMEELVQDPNEEKVVNLLSAVGIKDKKIQSAVRKGARDQLADGTKGWAAGPLPQERQTIETKKLFDKTFYSRSDFVQQLDQCHGAIYYGAMGIDESIQARSGEVERRILDMDHVDSFERLKNAKRMYVNLKLCKSMSSKCPEENPFFNVSKNLYEYDNLLNSDENGLCNKTYWESQINNIEREIDAKYSQ